MRGRRGTSLAEMIVACGLFTVFMMVSIGLFSNLTMVVRKEQNPAEIMTEGRIAALTLSRRIRNCASFVSPALWQVLRSGTDQLILRDQVLGKTVELRIIDGVLCEIYWPYDYDPLAPGSAKAEKALRLTPAQSLQIRGGGLAHPTRMTVEIVLTDGRTVRSISNFREAI